jgi:hypothetical protein
LVSQRRVRVTARSRRNERSRKRRRFSSALRWQHPFLRLRTPTGTGSENSHRRVRMEAGRIGGGETRAAGRGVGRSGAPVGRDHQCGGRTKKQKQNRSLESKSWPRVGLPVGPGVTVRGDPAKCGASRWSAMGVRGLGAQKHFMLDRDRPSHGSRDREGVGYFLQFDVSNSVRQGSNWQPCRLPPKVTALPK